MRGRSTLSLLCAPAVFAFALSAVLFAFRDHVGSPDLPAVPEMRAADISEADSRGVPSMRAELALAAGSGPATDERELPLFISFFTDCSEGTSGSTCGGPPGRWPDEGIPVSFCTYQANRPAGLSAQEFRDAVAAAAAIWNSTPVAVGVQYDGDCGGGAWLFGNGVNEVGFDDGRDAVGGSVAAIARGSWRNIYSGGLIQSREFAEFDIIVDDDVNVTAPCFLSIISHEMGHTLGLGHSDNPLDLMFASFNPSDPSNCLTVPTIAEENRLAELYGRNNAPLIAVEVPGAIPTSTWVTLQAGVIDPDGDEVTVTWEQIGGPTVATNQIGSSLQLLSPSLDGVTLTFRVLAIDPFLHLGVEEVTLLVDDSSGVMPLRTIPSLKSFLPYDVSSAALTWGSVENATRYQLCFETSCESVTSPVVTIDWDIILGAVGSPGERRVFTTGARSTSLAACNAIGCTAEGVGPLAGGLRWSSWDIDYDFIAMAFDVPGTITRFTIGGVVNVSGEPRKFRVYSGTLEDPFQVVLKNCGVLNAGQSCLGLLLPLDRGHYSHVTILSEKNGAPSTQHHIAVR